MRKVIWARLTWSQQRKRSVPLPDRPTLDLDAVIASCAVQRSRPTVVFYLTITCLGGAQGRFTNMAIGVFRYSWDILRRPVSWGSLGYNPNLEILGGFAPARSRPPRNTRITGQNSNSSQKMLLSLVSSFFSLLPWVGSFQNKPLVSVSTSRNPVPEPQSDWGRWMAMAFAGIRHQQTIPFLLSARPH
jgi:hypothetical protein